LLSLPVRRAELLIGTFLGVMLLCVLGIAYGAGGLWAVLAFKSGFYHPGPLLGALVSVFGFFAVYAVMLTTAVWVRSSALSAVCGVFTIALGLIASKRDTISAALSPGFGRSLFRAFTAPWPRLAELGDIAAQIATRSPVDYGELTRHVVASVIFGLAVLSLGIWKLEKQDF
jgi:Cu-processing system permease protein